MTITQKITNKEKIIKSLLVSPKTTGEIAKDLGYFDATGKYGRYNYVISDLNTLEHDRVIHRIKNKTKNPGKKPTVYELVYDIETLKKLYTQYPGIKSDIQKSEGVCGFIRDSVLGLERVEILTNVYEPCDNIFYHDLTEWFKLSPSFFEFCLHTDNKNITQRWAEYHFLDMGLGLIPNSLMVGSDHKLTRHRNQGTDDHLYNHYFYLIMEKIYEHCIYTDILNGQSNSEAKRHIEQKKIKEIESAKYLEYMKSPEYKAKLALHKSPPDVWWAEEEAKINSMSNDEKIEYFKKISKQHFPEKGDPFTEKMVQKYHIILK